MKDRLKKILIDNWERKLAAIGISVVVWFLVSQSITVKKVLYNVPIKIVNIPEGRTISGVSPDGSLDKTVTLSITGSKKNLELISSKDIEILLNAKGKGDDWNVQIKKNNLISLNPSLNILAKINSVSHPTITIKLSRLIKEKFTVYITKPVGDPPEGYQFLDIWPRELTYEVTGPSEAVNNLKRKSLKLTFNLNNITSKELNYLSAQHKDPTRDEVSFLVPDSWKKLQIPYAEESGLKIHSKDAKYLRIDFLKNELKALDRAIPISVFYGSSEIANINPKTISLATTPIVEEKEGLFFFKLPLLVNNVSNEYLKIIQDYLQLTIFPPESTSEKPSWTIEVFNPQYLENNYVQLLLSNKENNDLINIPSHFREDYLRERFRHFTYNLKFFLSKGHPLDLKIKVDRNKLYIFERSDQYENSNSKK